MLRSKAAPSQLDRPEGDSLQRVLVFVTLVAMAASAVLATLAGEAIRAISERPQAFLAFLALVVFLQLFSIELYGRGSLGVSATGMLAAGFFLGAGAAATIAVIAALIQWARRRGLFHRAVFDAANFSLSVAAAAAVYTSITDATSTTLVLIVAANVAGAAFAAVNNGLLCLAMSLSESLPLRAVWKERFHWARLHFLAFGPLALAIALAYRDLGVVAMLAFALPPALLAFSVKQYLDRTRDSVEEVRLANADLKRVNLELRDLTDRLRKTHRDTIAALSRSMEAKDGDTGDHTERVARIAVALGEHLGFSGEDLEAIEIGALLHDIGKIGIPESILLKPGPLDDEEWRKMRTHPLVSERILDEVELHPFVRQIARSSHERVDGQGYPDGLSGEEIPLPARIVLVADAFDAVTSDRPYRLSRTPAEALFEIRYHAGTQFCPVVVSALECLYADTPEVLGSKPSPALRVA
jgi:putative nucleotidyltransferase with HDIG domain